MNSNSHEKGRSARKAWDGMDRRRAEELFKSIFTHSPIGIYIVQNGKFVLCNHEFGEITGYHNDELMGMHSINLVFSADKDTVRDNAIRMLKGLRNTPYEFRVFTHSREVRWIIETVVSIAYQGKRAILGNFMDITERKNMEEKLTKSYETLQKTLNDAIDTIAKIVEMKDPYTSGHQRRVANLATAIAKEMKLGDDQIDQLRMAAIVHDIGKIYVPADILSKPGKLSDIEFQIIKTHSQGGYDVVKGMDFPCAIAQTILQHHERMDGSGYPSGLKGEDISLEARILAVSDVAEAMSSYRPYRPALGIDKALDEISQNKGSLYDPEVVDTCLKLFKEKGFTFE